MAAVKGKNTRPERLLREALFPLGLTAWSNNNDNLPGKPDLVFADQRVAVFVDGAFWHGHPSKYWQGRSGPYWDRKIAGNQERDKRVDAELQALGWTVLRLWDFEIEQDAASAARRVQEAVDLRRRLCLVKSAEDEAADEGESPEQQRAVAERSAAYVTDEVGRGPSDRPQ